jgi:hypothetical protein
MSKQYWILWPDKRAISAEKIKMWASDAWENGELRGEKPDLSDADACALALHEEGHITLARQPMEKTS